MSNNTLDIGEVARLSSLPTSTLRYYEEKGLIQSTGRHGLRRQYSENVLERLGLISLGRQAGFSLEEISVIFATDGRPRIDKKKLLKKADELEKTIQQLTAMRKGLLHAAACDAPHHLDCPNFQRLLGIANRKESRLRRKTP